MIQSINEMDIDHIVLFICYLTYEDFLELNFKN